MDASNVLSLLEQLDDEIDDLEGSLAPLLNTTLAETSSKLPVLDKAKLYVLVTYAIESVLFSYLRLNGVKARDHPVFIELTRVRQYFEKIKAAEKPVGERNLTLDKGAASRIIRAGLATNDKHDLERAEQQAKERAKAHIRFEELSMQIAKRKAEAVDEEQEVDSDLAVEGSNSDAESSVESPEELKVASTGSKKQKLDSVPTSGASSPSEKSKRKKSKSKRSKKQKIRNVKVAPQPS